MSHQLIQKIILSLTCLLALLVIAATGIAFFRVLTEPKVARSDISSREKAISYDLYYLPFDIAEEKIREDLSFLKDQHITGLYVTASEEDLDNPIKLEKIIRLGRELGFRLYLNPYIGTNSSGEIYLSQHPQNEMVSRRGVESNWGSVNDPTYRQYLKGVVTKFAAYDFDGIQFDEPAIGHLGLLDENNEGDYYPYDSFSQKLFKERYGYSMPYYDNHDTSEFRASSMEQFLQELVDHARSKRPDWVIGVTLFADLKQAEQAGVARWDFFANINNLDVLMIAPYWFPDVDHGWKWFVGSINALGTATQDSHVIPGVWVRGFNLAGNYDYISKSLDYLNKRNVQWQAVWMSENSKNDDPNAVWAEIKRAYTTP